MSLLEVIDIFRSDFKRINMMNITINRCLFACIALSTCLSKLAWAETPRESLEKLCRSKHVSVIMDGYCPKLFASDKNRNNVYEIADSLDCSIENYNGIYLLRKRYSLSRDIPAVTVEEITASFEKMQSVLDIFNVNMKPTVAEYTNLTRRSDAIVASRMADLFPVPKKEGSESEWTALDKMDSSAVNLFRQLAAARTFGDQIYSNDSSPPQAAGYPKVDGSAVSYKPAPSATCRCGADYDASVGELTPSD